MPNIWGKKPTPFLLQLLALHPSTCLVSGHPPSSKQSSLSSLPLASSRSSSVILAVLAFSVSLATHFKIQSNPQNTIVIPSQHMSIPSNSIRLDNLDKICKMIVGKSSLNASIYTNFLILLLDKLVD